MIPFPTQWLLSSYVYQSMYTSFTIYRKIASQSNILQDKFVISTGIGPLYIEHLHTLNGFGFPMSVQCTQVSLFVVSL